MKALLSRTVKGLPEFEPAVDHALFLVGYRNLLNTGVGQIALAGLVALATHQRADTLTLALWLGYLVLAGGGYLALRWHFTAVVKQPGPNVAGVKRWYRYRRVLQVISSAGWGGLGALLVPEAPAHNVIVMTAFAGVVGHSAAGNSANDFLGFVISAVTVLLVFLWHLPAIFGVDASALMVMCVFYVAALTTVLHNTHKSLRESIRLRLDHEVLARSHAEQARRAEQANRDKSEFLAAASHDLRQPVHALLLLIEAYRLQVPAAMTHPLLQHITLAGQSINSLFNALMELARLESGSEKPVSAEFALPTTLQQVLRQAEPEARHKALSLRSFQARSVAGWVVYSDQLLLQRILSNLLANALHYTPRGGVLLATRPAHGSAGIWIEVWDTGIGIAPEQQARVFDPYVQIANPERDRSKGLGLGLAIVKHACALLGLAITVTSTPGRGTRFRVALPASMVTQRGSDQVTAATVMAVTQAAPWLAGRRVLLVDDDPLVQVAMQAVLRTWSLDVRSATRGDASALEVCAADWVPECVLCDFRLPGPLNGIALLDLIQRRFPQAIGVLLTGELLQTVQQQAEDAGYLLLTKPIDAEVLAFTLGALLERRHEERRP